MQLKIEEWVIINRQNLTIANQDKKNIKVSKGWKVELIANLLNWLLYMFVYAHL